MITKEQFQAMQNYEISLVLCDLLGYKVEFIHAAHESEFPTINVFGKTVGEWFAVEFGRWDCIMPLAVEYGISFLNAGNGLMFTATNNYELLCDKRLSDPEFKEAGGIYFIDVEPLRAIACCLILVLQEQKQ